jgi:hypothetical protein
MGESVVAILRYLRYNWKEKIVEKRKKM